MTRQGLFPINEIRKGTLIFTKSGWKPSPKAVIGEVVKCTFKTLPTTCFDKSLISETTSFSLCHNVILNKNEENQFGMSVRGYFSEDNSYIASNINGPENLSYWLPRFSQFFHSAPLVIPKGYTFAINTNRDRKFTNLFGDELSEPNLEYYLEGYLRRGIFIHGNQIHLGTYGKSILTESDKLVLRLLDIDLRHELNNKIAIRNNYNFLKHIRDTYNKSKISNNIIEDAINNRLFPLPEHIYPLKIEYTEDYILPGINSYINTILPNI